MHIYMRMMNVWIVVNFYFANVSLPVSGMLTYNDVVRCKQPIFIFSKPWRSLANVLSICRRFSQRRLYSFAKRAYARIGA